MILQWDESFDIGSDTLTGVNDDDYTPPFPLTAKLNKLTIKVDRPQLSPEEALTGLVVRPSLATKRIRRRAAAKLRHSSRSRSPISHERSDTLQTNGRRMPLPAPSRLVMFVFERHLLGRHPRDRVQLSRVNLPRRRMVSEGVWPLAAKSLIEPTVLKAIAAENVR